MCIFYIMYISKLTLHGFKSFAKKEELLLGEGITTVVGPNGCGKTNIVDAIRWVLGEQKHSVLRSGKMEDIIFNGAAGLKPLSMSEVTLTVHNNSGKLPVEYMDIEIGRRVFRNGESEYFMNRTPCRLKDIQDLFVDTGMGADAYSVIELKMIEQILSETGDDRKRMFEEASGINRYKQQRRATLKKFDAVKADLENINNIIAEVETKVHGLNLQLKRFKRHEKLTINLKEKDIQLATIQLKRIEDQVAPIMNQLRQLQQTRESHTTEEHLHEKELNQLRKAFQASLKELEEIQSELQTLESERDQFQQNNLVWNEQIRSAEAAIGRLEHETVTNKSKQESLNVHIKDYQKALSDLEPRIEEKLEYYKQKREAFTHVEKSYQEAKENLERIQSMRWDVQRKAADKQSLIQRTRSMMEEKQKTIRQLEEGIATLEQSQEDLAADQKIFEKQKTEIAEKIETLNKSIKDQEKILDLNQKNRHNLTLKHHSTITQVETLESQLQFYRELLMTGEGYPSGVKHVLNHPDQYPEVIGTIADLFTVSDEYRLAIETALGEIVNVLVVRTRSDALAVLERVTREKSGQVMILHYEGLPEQKPLPAPSGQVGEAASQIVTVREELQPLVSYLLGNIWIVPSLEKMDPPDGFTLVDHDGMYSGSNYILKNKRESSQGIIVGRKEKIAELDKEISRLVAVSEDIKNQLDRADAEIEALGGEMEELSLEVGSLIDEQSGLETEIIRNHYQQSQTLEKLQEQNQRITELRKEIIELSKSLDVLEPQLKDEEVRLNNLAEKQNEAQDELVRAQQARDNFQQEMQEIRIELLNLENQRDNLEFQRQTAQDTLQELTDRFNKIEQEIIDFQDRIKDLTKKIQENQERLTKVEGRITKQRSLYELKRDTNNENFRQIETLESQIRNEQHSREELLEELKQAELRLADYQQNKSIIMARIRDRYQATLPEHLPDDIVRDDQTMDDLEMSIQRIERSIENIGPINMAVQQEYDEEKERLDLLREQRDDLIQSEENLRETIQKIDRVARQKFRETFLRIKENFEKLFVMFFEGGKGSIAMVGDPDPLDSDIAIYAQPPGKRNQSIRLLSAGEKALTAIALLFAIYQVKPSPYCILDEVDAPLDDTNIHKFTRVLHKFSDATQFIVVTHNKLTMEAADYMYGVTMEQKGVSKLVSVKFN